MVGDGMTDLESCPPAVSDFELWYMTKTAQEIIFQLKKNSFFYHIGF